MTVTITDQPLTPEELIRIARGGETVVISDAVLAHLAQRRDDIEVLVQSGEPVYGVSTGFGSLATTFVSPEDRRALQQALVRSHAAGLGPVVEVEVVRAMMVSRLSTLCSGVTGVRPMTAQAYANLLNAFITPVVHEYGSLGCSGDLAPLAHVALVIMGEGEAFLADGSRVSGAQALAQAGLEPVVLAEKEGLALLNGTDGMLGHLILALRDGRELLALADVAAALSIQALRGTDRTFIAELQALRPHPGQATSAANLLRLMADSPMVASHASDRTRCKTRTPFVAHPRCTALLGTPSPTPLASPRLNSLRPSIIPRCYPMDDCRQTAISTGHPWPTYWTS